MPGEVNCIFTKGLIPFVEQEVGPDGVAAILRLTGKTREYLMADHNWLPLALADGLVRLCQELMDEPDEERWARRFGESFMDWKPREQRSYMGTYSMAYGSPRVAYRRQPGLTERMIVRFLTFDAAETSRRTARLRCTPAPGYRMPLWTCVWLRVVFERLPTNWNLPRAEVRERRCAARGAEACDWEVRWRNPPLGARFWAPAAAGGAAAALLGLAQAGAELPWPVLAASVAAPALLGVTLGAGLRERHRRREAQRMLDLQSDEVLYSNQELEQKFRDIETKIEQLSLLIDLAATVNATLDPEKIYDQTLDRLVHRMGYQGAQLWIVDRQRRVVRGSRMAGMAPEPGVRFEDLAFPLEPPGGVVAKAAALGVPVCVNDVDQTTEPVRLDTARALNVRALVAIPLRVKERIFGVLNVVAAQPGRFGDTDVELLSAVANHVALALDRADSFRTIEELSLGLEDKVRVRTEQLRAANEELQAAYRDLQQTQMQLVQREKMASVGQLVAGVAHELNNPIGFVFSNVTTLEDFVRRLRAMLDAYRAVALPEAERARLAERWAELKVDYALRYFDSMIGGIREGAERARKIVRDLRVFARGGEDTWQAVDLHEELESSLTLLNHLLKDRVTVQRKFGELPSVECVRSQIDQVFLNLLANAAQAIQGPGAITIETRREGETAVVAITDSGPGIAPDVLGRVFDPFFTTKPVGEGTGLGLSISYEIVEKHGGEIGVASPPGQGATFTLRLPLARAARP
jgi:signal transduction histidine kinase